MKKICLVFLMLVLPLQAVLVAVEIYHGHGFEHQSPIEAVVHTHHGHDHPTDHPTLDTKQQDNTCDADHHHCHAHSASVLPSLLTIEMLPHALDQEFDQFAGFQSFSSNRIERPKWA